MNEGLIPSRYAKALHLYAEEAGKAAAVYEQTERLAAGYEAHPQMSRAVENPFLPLADKQQLLLVASGAENDGCLDKFFKLVFSHGRESFIRSMALAYGKRYRDVNKISQVEIATASSFSQAVMDKIKDSVQTHLKGRTLEYRQRVDASLIGGFTVRVDGEVLDASMNNDLRKLRLKLLSKK